MKKEPHPYRRDMGMWKNSRQTLENVENLWKTSGKAAFFRGKGMENPMTAHLPPGRKTLAKKSQRKIFRGQKPLKKRSKPRRIDIFRVSKAENTGFATLYLVLTYSE